MAIETEYDEPAVVREVAEPTAPDFTVGSWVHIQIADGQVADVHRTPDLSWHAVVDVIAAAFFKARVPEEAIIAELYRVNTARLETDAKNAAQRRGKFLAVILDRAMGR